MSRVAQDGLRRRRRVRLIVGLPLGVLAALSGVFLIYSVTTATSSAAGPGAGSTTTAARASAPATAPATTGSSPTASPTGRVYLFPVVGSVSYARTHHDYPATDIMARCGSPVVAVTSGVVLDTTTVDAYDPRVDAGATRGGLSVSLLGDDGVRYYGSHLSKVDAKIKPGVRVTAGQRLGDVGETGNASACHLHFGISPPCQRVGDWWIQRGAIWPWSYLDAWRAHRAKSPAADVQAWQQKHGCPTAPNVDP